MKICVLQHRFNKSGFTYDKDSIEKNYSYIMPSGLSYISSTLKSEGFDVTFLNLNHRGGLVKDIIDLEFKVNKYDIVFMGSLSFHYPNVRDDIKYIRKSSPYTIIVVGGGMISSQPGIMLKLLKPDIAVIGEGEKTVIDIVNSMKNGTGISKIDGIGYIRDGEVVINNPRLPIDNLDTIPFPDFIGSELNDYLDRIDPLAFYLYDVFDKPRVYPLVLSRSCPYGCTFCYHPIGKKYRQRSLDNVMEEIKFAIKEFKINIFICNDELFSMNRDRVIEFCRRFNEIRSSVDWDIKWNCSLRVDNIDDELIKIMKDAGCFSIGLGLESYSSTVLNSMKKHTNPEDIKNAMTIITNNGVAAWGTFIFGDPAETMETAKETLDYFRNHQNIIRGAVQLGFIIPFQGSPLYKHCLEKGIIKDEIEFIEDRAKNGYTFFNPINMTSLSDEDFMKLKDEVMVTIYTAGYHVAPLSSQVIGGISEVNVECPYCNKISILKNVIPPTGNSTRNVGCRHCNSRFELVSKYYGIRYFMLKTFGFYTMLKVSNIMGGIRIRMKKYLGVS